MLEITIPGYGQLKLSNLLLDFNGTLAVGGCLIKGIASHLNALAEKLELHIITGDTFGNVRKELDGIQCQLSILTANDQTIAKANYLQQLNPKETIAIGNGRNDQQMLKDAIIGIAVMGEEGLASETLMAADLVVSNIFDAFALLNDPRRLIATLRS